jgi:methionine aminopeptidase
MLEKLRKAEEQANILFKTIEDRGLIVAGKTEEQLNTEIYNLAFELFKTKKFWHKRIVRAGKNTILVYKENPENLTLQKDDIIFLDFGPVIGDWEADLGKTYVLGNNKNKLKLKNDIEQAWIEGKEFYEKNKLNLTGADFYNYTKQLALKYGWEYVNDHCGHLIGKFPHERTIGEEKINYICAENAQLMSNKDKNGDERFWIYEMHFIDKELGIGAFFEQLLS